MTLPRLMGAQNPCRSGIAAGVISPHGRLSGDSIPITVKKCYVSDGWLSMVSQCSIRFAFLALPDYLGHHISTDLCNMIPIGLGC